jgi:hypothetical protein
MTRLASLLALGCLSGFGQCSGTGNTIPGAFKAMVISAQSRFTPVTGAPYSGQKVTETVQTLADGTHIRHTTTPIKVYRDSFGRTREERSPFQGLADQAPNATERPTLVEILDPVGQFKYTLDVRGKVAHRQMLTTAANRPSPAPVSQAAPMSDLKTPQRVKEQLKSQIVEGVLASGTRSTVTQPEGSVGNDRPFIVVQESWWSVELKVGVLNKTTDPRDGERTVKLTNISRSEPDPSLFQPPPDYTIVDEKGSFTIMWGKEQQ